MGLVRQGPPLEFVEELLARFEIPNFVETGTLDGETAGWAAARFANVFTIELSPRLYAAAAATLSARKNVRVIEGSSPAALGELLPLLEGPTLFWLDAHWSGGETSGVGDECPLLEELAVVTSYEDSRFVLIDDARMFTAPAPPPHDPAQWPSIREVLELLSADGYAEPAIVEDVIVSVPLAARDDLVRFANSASKTVWDEHVRRVVPSVRGGAALVREGAELIALRLRAQAARLL